MNSFKITEEVLDNVLGYLGKQPYEDVSRLIMSLAVEMRAGAIAPPKDKPEGNKK